MGLAPDPYAVNEIFSRDQGQELAGGFCQTRKNMLEAKYLERSQTDPLSAYGWMRVLSQAHRREGPAKAFLSISQSMGGHVTPDAQRHPPHRS